MMLADSVYLVKYLAMTDLDQVNGLGPWIKERRQQLGLKQWEFAELIGTSRAYMSQIEAGGTKLPGADLRRRIADALGVSHLALLVEAGEITEDEIVRAGAVSTVQDGPLESRLISLIRGINWEPDQAAFAEQVIRQMFERGKR